MNPDICGTRAISIPYERIPLNRREALAEWLAFDAAKLPELRARTLQCVNQAVNDFLKFGPDRPGDEWRGPAETLAGGVADCEEHALAKMALLQTLGENINDAYITTGLFDGVGHAVVSVRLFHGDWLILDSGLTDDPIPHARYASVFLPWRSFRADQAFIHGRPND